MSRTENIQPLSIPNLLIGEQIQSENASGQIDGVFSSRLVAEKLTGQMPHRVYANQDLVLRTLFHTDRNGHAAAIELLRKRGGQIQQEKFFVIGGTQKGITDEVERTRRLYGLYPENIISNPSSVLQVVESRFGDGHYIHLGSNEDKPPHIAYHYTLSPLGHRCMGIQIGEIKLPDHTNIIHTPPEAMIAHGI